MTPDKARIFYVEDDSDSREVTGEFLENGGHSIVESASTIIEALSKIPFLGNKGVNVAIVDGNLSTGDVSGRDGENVASQIKAQHKGIIVIGHALDAPIHAADINCTKLQGSSKLVDVVRKA